MDLDDVAHPSAWNAGFSLASIVPTSSQHGALLDGGTTEGGLPYFIMEYVDGRQTTEVGHHPRIA